MPDFAGASGTITAPSLVSWDERRRQARDERERQKLKRLHELRQINQAAADSLTRSAPKPVRVKAANTPRARAVAGEHAPRQYELKIVPCVRCEHPTRAANVTIDRAPNTLPRRGGLCSNCAPPRPRTGDGRPDPIRPCNGTCGRMTRPAKIPLTEAPDTVPRKAQGKCSTCLSGGVKPRPPKVDPTQLVDAYASGMSLRQVADKYGITPSTVKRHVTKHMPLRSVAAARPPKPPLASVDALKADYAAGMSIIGIATKHGIGKTTVRTYLLAAGVELRTQGLNVSRPNLPTIRVCAGTCGRLTRPRNGKYPHPGAVSRAKDGMCSQCLTGDTRRGPKVDPAVLITEYTAGGSLKAIGKRHGIHRSTVRWHLDNAGVPRREATMYNGGNL